MTRHLLFGVIRFLMVFTPFLSMAMMILALWGVVGTATYTDLDATKDIAFDAKEAKNYLVNETKIIEKCPEESNSPGVVPEEEEEKSMPGKIDWGRVA